MRVISYSRESSLGPNAHSVYRRQRPEQISLGIVTVATQGACEKLAKKGPLVRYVSVMRFFLFGHTLV